MLLVCVRAVMQPAARDSLIYRKRILALYVRGESRWCTKCQLGGSGSMVIYMQFFFVPSIEEEMGFLNMAIVGNVLEYQHVFRYFQ